MLIKNTKDQSVNCLKFLIFGSSGSGKTSLAKTLSDKTLIISAESGLLSLVGADIDVFDIGQNDNGEPVSSKEKIANINKAYKYLLTEECQKKYKVIFIDSLTEIAEIYVEQLKSEHVDAKDTFKMWGEYSKRMTTLIKAFRDIPYYNVVMTALSEIDKDESNRMFIGVDMPGKISKQCVAMFDEVFYLNVNDQTSEREFVTNRTNKITAKDRSGKLSAIEKPDLNLVITKIKGEKKDVK